MITHKQFNWVAANLLLVVATNSLAYDFGGHHYTLSAAFHDDSNGSKSEDYKPLRELEAFCSELPDLSQELDATTQRIHVARS